MQLNQSALATRCQAGAAAIDLCFHGPASAFPHRPHAPPPGAGNVVRHRLLPLSTQRQLYRRSQTLCAIESSCRASSPHEDDDDGARDAFLARQSTLGRIQSAGVIACLRSANEGVALQAGRAALDGGVSVLEVTMTTSGAVEVIQKLVCEYPSATIGAGTVVTWQDAERAKEAGATFLASPVTNKELVQAHSRSNVLFIPGAMTPSEILQARRWGASCVKLYPVSMMGGVQYVEMLKKLFPNIPIIASNGICVDSVKSYLQVGATAVILSDAVFDKIALSQHDYAQIFHLSTLVTVSITSDISALKHSRGNINPTTLNEDKILSYSPNCNIGTTVVTNLSSISLFPNFTYNFTHGATWL